MTELEKKQAETIARLQEENELLRQKIDLLVRRIFGKSSEQLDLDQLLLFESDDSKKPVGDDSAVEDAGSSPKSNKPRRRRTSREATLPADLPVEETTLLPDEVKEHPEHYRQIGEETTVKLDYQPAQFRKLVTRRPKFVKRLRTLGEPEHFYIAPLSPCLKQRSLLTPRLAAQIATNRYCNHQPYYRQEQHFLTHHRIHLPRSIMSQWMGDLAHDYLSGIYRAMQESLLENRYLQADETPIDYLEPGHGSTRKGYLWTLARPDLKTKDGRGDILYQWHPGRYADCLRQLLQTPNKTFLGILQTDGYQAYRAYAAQKENLELVGCCTHVRRKFHEAREQKPKLSGWILNQISNLYHIESRLRKQRAGPRLREHIRRTQSLPIYRRIGKALPTIRRKVLPKSNLGKAIDYALGQWLRLERCFTDGRLEIDNNLIENGIRPTKVGAKNWLFMGSEQSGQSNAIWYTLIESCRRRQLDPWRYLVWIFEELPKLKVKRDTFAGYTPEAYARHLRQKNRVKRSA